MKTTWTEQIKYPNRRANSLYMPQLDWEGLRGRDRRDMLNAKVLECYVLLHMLARDYKIPLSMMRTATEALGMIPTTQEKCGCPRNTSQTQIRYERFLRLRFLMAAT